jgi:spermidine synthase
LVALPVDQIVRAGVMPDGTKITVQHMEESFYGRIQVLDFSYKEHLLRELMIDGMVQGGTDPRSGLAAYETVVLMERLPLLLTKSPERALVIGLGPGTMPIFYEKNGVTTDVVDIDPAVIETARKWFDFNISGNVYIEDARQVVSTLSKPYDIIILDIFNGDVQPAHVMSLEALKDIKRILKPGGVLTINIVGALKGRTRMTESVVKTLDAAGFNQIDLYPMFEMIDTEDDLWGNIVLTAYEGSKRHIDLTRLQDWPVNIMANNAMTFIQTPIRIEPTVQAIILSDDYAPLDVEDAWMREAVRLSIQGNLDPSLLMGE